MTWCHCVSHMMANSSEGTIEKVSRRPNTNHLVNNSDVIWSLCHLAGNISDNVANNCQSKVGIWGQIIILMSYGRRAILRVISVIMLPLPIKSENLRPDDGKCFDTCACNMIRPYCSSLWANCLIRMDKCKTVNPASLCLIIPAILSLFSSECLLHNLSFSSSTASDGGGTWQNVGEK